MSTFNESKKNAFDKAAERILFSDISEKNRSQQRIRQLAEKIREVYLRRTGNLYPLPVVVGTLTNWLDSELEAISDKFDSLLHAPSQADAQDFKKMLATLLIEDFIQEAETDNELVFICTKTESSAETRPLPSDEFGTVGENLYNGFRVFSPKKFAAMIDYIVQKSNFIYRTKLNRLLFYADFANFYRSGKSITGARYFFEPFGPAEDDYETILGELEETGHLQIQPAKMGQIRVEKINSLPKQSRQYHEFLSTDERSTIDWVINRFGRLSAREIDHSLQKDKLYIEGSRYIFYSFSRVLPHFPEIKKKVRNNVRYASFTK